MSAGNESRLARLAHAYRATRYIVGPERFHFSLKSGSTFPGIARSPFAAIPNGKVETTFPGIARGPTRAIHLRIGEPAPALQKLIRQHRAAGAALITAFNPASRLRPQALNRAAGARLARDLKPISRRRLPYRAEADAGNWPDEFGIFAIGPSLGQARRLARRHGQIALVWLPERGPARLVFTAGLRCAANGRER